MPVWGIRGGRLMKTLEEQLRLIKHGVENLLPEEDFKKKLAKSNC